MIPEADLHVLSLEAVELVLDSLGEDALSISRKLGAKPAKRLESLINQELAKDLGDVSRVEVIVEADDAFVRLFVQPPNDVPQEPVMIPTSLLVSYVVVNGSE